jgi:hypothetical protein
MADSAPSDPTPVHLTGEIASAVDGAAVRGVPLSIVYVDGSGRPHLSLRGTVQVHAEDQLALWARSRGLPDALASNPNVALLYQDLAQRTFYQFSGRGRVVSGPEERNRVFDNSPEHERARDPEREGTAIVIDVDAVHGRGPGGRVEMTSDRSDPVAG